MAAAFNFKNSGSKKFSTWVNDKAIPVMGKVGNQRHLSAIRDGFAIVTPLIIASAVAIVLFTSLFGGWGTEKSSLFGVFANWSGRSLYNDAGDPISQLGVFTSEMKWVIIQINNFGLALISIYFTYSLGYFLAKSKNNNAPEIAGLVALGAFFIATTGGSSSASFFLTPGANGVAGTRALASSGFMGSEGIFTSIVVSIVAMEIYCWLSQMKKLEIQLPAGVPPAVSRSFAKLLPAIITSMAIAAILGIIAIPTHLTHASMIVSEQVKVGDTTSNVIRIAQATDGSRYNIGDLIYMAIQSPFIYAASVNGANLGIAILYTLIVGFFWSFGLHGTNIANGIFNPVWSTLQLLNVSLLAQGKLASEGNIFVAGTFDAFVFFGGTGATLPLIIATLSFGKKASEKAIAKFAAPAGVFNINEPVVFGYPLIINPVYAIPFIFVMPILTISTWIFYNAFGTTYVTVPMPWTAPVGVGALFATQFDYTSFLIVLINFILAFLMWLPFVFLSNKQDAKQRQLNEQQAQNQAKVVSKGV